MVRCSCSRRRDELLVPRDATLLRSPTRPTAGHRPPRRQARERAARPRRRSRSPTSGSRRWSTRSRRASPRPPAYRLRTPAYMSPEQAMAKGVGLLTDLYAVGVMAYEMLVGRVPFTADTPIAVLLQHVNEPLPGADRGRGRRPALPPCCGGVSPRRRPSAGRPPGAFSAALEAAAGGRDPAGRRWLRCATPGAAADSRRPAGPRAPRPGPAAASPRRRSLLWAAGRRGRSGSRAYWPSLGRVARSLALRPASPPARPSVRSPTPAPQAGCPRRRRPRRATPRTTRAPVPTPTPPHAATVAAPDSVATPEPAGGGRQRARRRARPPWRARSGPVRVYCEAKLEAVQFRKTGAKDVADSLKDLREAIAKRDGLAARRARAARPRRWCRCSSGAASRR